MMSHDEKMGGSRNIHSDNQYDEIKVRVEISTATINYDE